MNCAAVEYQLATETPLGKTAKKKKIKRKPAAELEPLPVHYPLLIFISTLFSVWVLDIWRFGLFFERAEFGCVVFSYQSMSWIENSE